MEPREFTNKLIGYEEQEKERRLWLAYVHAVNNPYLKQKPGSFKEFCDKMTIKKTNIKLSEKQFLKLIDSL